MQNLILYTMGRVGTNYVSNVIPKNNYLITPVHSFDRRRAVDGIPRTHNKIINGKILTLEKLRQEKLLVITCVRDPILRALSAYCFFHQAWGIAAHTKPPMGRKIFLEKYRHDWALNFFDEEIKKHIGIDIYDYELKGFGAKTIENDAAKLIIVRTEKMDKLLRAELNANGIATKGSKYKHGMRKNMGGLYSNLKKLKYPKEYVDKMLGSKMVQHLFSDQEIKEMRVRWSE